VPVAQVIDDSYWRTLEVYSNDVCSYRLENSDESVTRNVFEVQLANLQNVQVGLYYGRLSSNRTKVSKLTDMKVFDPVDCNKMVNCVVNK